MNVLGTQAPPTIRYKDYFSQAKVQEYVSTRHVVDSLLRYERLLNYRFYVTKGNNVHYWFLLNVVDVTLRDSNFYKYLFKDGRELDAHYMYNVLSDFRRSITIEYPAKSAKPWIVKDTLQVIKVWLKALSNIKSKSDENVQN